FVFNTEGKCNRDRNLEVELSVGNISNGVPPFSFSWSVDDDCDNDEFSDNNSSAVTYSAPNGFDCGFTFGRDRKRVFTVIITDSRGCVGVLEKEVKTPREESIDAEVIKTSPCDDLSNGMITLVITGGTPPYKVNLARYGNFIQMQDSEDNNIVTFQNLNEGNYSAIITDKNGCSVEIGEGSFSENLYLPNDIGIAIYEEKIVKSCPNEPNGSIVFRIRNQNSDAGNFHERGELSYTLTNSSGGIVAQGIGTLEFEPSGGAALSYELFVGIDGLSAGNYVFQIQDERGCSKSTEIEIVELSDDALLPLEYELVYNDCKVVGINILNYTGIDYYWNFPNDPSDKKRRTPQINLGEEDISKCIT
ncbi:MAG: hypothetical protein AAFO82_23965, partial [Bacteroidota bacterium]